MDSRVVDRLVNLALGLGYRYPEYNDGDTEGIRFEGPSVTIVCA